MIVAFAYECGEAVSIDASAGIGVVDSSRDIRVRARVERLAASTGAAPLHRCPHGESVEPHFQWRVAAKLLELSEDRQERLLCDVLGVIDVGGVRERPAIQHRMNLG